MQKSNCLLFALYLLLSIPSAYADPIKFMTPQGPATPIPGRPLSPQAEMYLATFPYDFSSAWMLDAFRYIHTNEVMNEAAALEVLDMPREKKNDPEQVEYHYRRRMHYLKNQIMMGEKDPDLLDGLSALEAALNAARHCLLNKTLCIYVPALHKLK